MHVGESCSVTYDAVDDFGRAITKTVRGLVEYVHPEGRYASVRVPSGYLVTVYPPRRVGGMFEAPQARRGPRPGHRI